MTMPNDYYRYNFDSTPPLEGAPGGGLVHIDAGAYSAKLKSYKDAPNKKGKRMVTIEMAIDGGAEDGIVLSDFFTLVPDKNGQNTAARRLHQFFQAIRLKVPKGEFELTPDQIEQALIDRPCIIHVVDKVLPPSDVTDDEGNVIHYDEKTVSKISYYESLPKAERPSPPKAEPAPAPAPQRPVAVATVATADETDSLFGDDD